MDAKAYEKLPANVKAAIRIAFRATVAETLAFQEAGSKEKTAPLLKTDGMLSAFRG